MIGLRSGYKFDVQDYSFVTSERMAEGLANINRKQVMLPDVFDPPDQKKAIPCCVSCSVVKAMEVLDSMAGNITRLSPMFHYYYARPNQQGLPWLTISDGIYAAISYGVCEYSLYPSDFTLETLENVEPAEEAIEDALNHTINDVDPETDDEGYWPLQLYDPVDSWKRTLIAGMPIVFGFHIPDEYFLLDHSNPEYDGTIILHITDEFKSNRRHAATVIGFQQDFDRNKGYFRIADSRGIEFGDNGRWWMSFETLNHDLIIDAWAISSICY